MQPIKFNIRSISSESLNSQKELATESIHQKALRALPTFSRADAILMQQYELGIRDIETGEISPTFNRNFPEFASLPREVKDQLLGIIDYFLKRPRRLVGNLRLNQHQCEDVVREMGPEAHLPPIFIDFTLDHILQMTKASERIEVIAIIGKCANELRMHFDPEATKKMYEGCVDERLIDEWFQSEHVRDYYRQVGSDIDVRLWSTLSGAGLFEIHDEILNAILRGYPFLGPLAESLAPFIKTCYPRIWEKGLNAIDVVRHSLVNFGGLTKKDLINNETKEFAPLGIYTCPIFELQYDARPIDFIPTKRLEATCLSSKDCPSIEINGVLDGYGSLTVSNRPFTDAEYICDCAAEVISIHPSHSIEPKHLIVCITTNSRFLKSGQEKRIVDVVFANKKQYQENSKTYQIRPPFSNSEYIAAILHDYFKVHQKPPTLRTIILFRACEMLYFYSQFTDEDIRQLWSAIDNCQFFEPADLLDDFYRSLRKMIIEERRPFSEIHAFLQTYLLALFPHRLSFHEGVVDAKPLFKVSLGSKVEKPQLQLVLHSFAGNFQQKLDALLENPLGLEVMEPLFSSSFVEEDFDPIQLASNLKLLQFDRHHWIIFAKKCLEHPNSFTCFLGIIFYLNTPGMTHDLDELLKLIPRMMVMPKNWRVLLLNRLKSAINKIHPTPFAHPINDFDINEDKNLFENWICALARSANPNFVHQAYQLVTKELSCGRTISKNTLLLVLGSLRHSHHRIALQFYQDLRSTRIFSIKQELNYFNAIIGHDQEKRWMPIDLAQLAEIGCELVAREPHKEEYGTDLSFKGIAGLIRELERQPSLRGQATRLLLLISERKCLSSSTTSSLWFEKLKRAAESTPLTFIRDVAVLYLRAREEKYLDFCTDAQQSELSLIVSRIGAKLLEITKSHPDWVSMEVIRRFIEKGKASTEGLAELICAALIQKIRGSEFDAEFGELIGSLRALNPLSFEPFLNQAFAFLSTSTSSDSVQALERILLEYSDLLFQRANASYVDRFMGHIDSWAPKATAEHLQSLYKLFEQKLKVHIKEDDLPRIAIPFRKLLLRSSELKSPIPDRIQGWMERRQLVLFDALKKGNAYLEAQEFLLGLIRSKRTRNHSVETTFWICNEMIKNGVEVDHVQIFLSTSSIHSTGEFLNFILLQPEGIEFLHRLLNCLLVNPSVRLDIFLPYIKIITASSRDAFDRQRFMEYSIRLSAAGFHLEACRLILDIPFSDDEIPRASSAFQKTLSMMTNGKEELTKELYLHPNALRVLGEQTPKVIAKVERVTLNLLKSSLKEALRLIDSYHLFSEVIWLTLAQMLMLSTDRALIADFLTLLIKFEKEIAISASQKIHFYLNIIKVFSKIRIEKGLEHLLKSEIVKEETFGLTENKLMQLEACHLLILAAFERIALGDLAYIPLIKEHLRIFDEGFEQIHREAPAQISEEVQQWLLDCQIIRAKILSHSQDPSDLTEALRLIKSASPQVLKSTHPRNGIVIETVEALFDQLDTNHWLNPLLNECVELVTTTPLVHNTTSLCNIYQKLMENPTTDSVTAAINVLGCLLATSRAKNYKRQFLQLAEIGCQDKAILYSKEFEAIVKTGTHRCECSKQDKMIVIDRYFKSYFEEADENTTWNLKRAEQGINFYVRWFSAASEANPKIVTDVLQNVTLLTVLFLHHPQYPDLKESLPHSGLHAKNILAMAFNKLPKEKYREFFKQMFRYLAGFGCPHFYINGIICLLIPEHSPKDAEGRIFYLNQMVFLEVYYPRILSPKWKPLFFIEVELRKEILELLEMEDVSDPEKARKMLVQLALRDEIRWRTFVKFPKESYELNLFGGVSAQTKLTASEEEQIMENLYEKIKAVPCDSTVVCIWRILDRLKVLDLEKYHRLLIRILEEFPSGAILELILSNIVEMMQTVPQRKSAEHPHKAYFTIILRKTIQVILIVLNEQRVCRKRSYYCTVGLDIINHLLYLDNKLRLEYLFDLLGQLGRFIVRHHLEDEPLEVKSLWAQENDLFNRWIKLAFYQSSRPLTEDDQLHRAKALMSVAYEAEKFRAGPTCNTFIAGILCVGIKNKVFLPTHPPSLLFFNDVMGKISASESPQEQFLARYLGLYFNIQQFDMQSYVNEILLLFDLVNTHPELLHSGVLQMLLDLMIERGSLGLEKLQVSRILCLLMRLFLQETQSKIERGEVKDGQEVPLNPLYACFVVVHTFEFNLEIAENQAMLEEIEEWLQLIFAKSIMVGEIHALMRMIKCKLALGAISQIELMKILPFIGSRAIIFSNHTSAIFENIFRSTISHTCSDTEGMENVLIAIWKNHISNLLTKVEKLPLHEKEALQDHLRHFDITKT